MICGTYIISPGNRKSTGTGKKRGVFICLLNISNILENFEPSFMAEILTF